MLFKSREHFLEEGVRWRVQDPITVLAQKQTESNALRSFFRGNARRTSKGRIGIPGFCTRWPSCHPGTFSLLEAYRFVATQVYCSSLPYFWPPVVPPLTAFGPVWLGVSSHCDSGRVWRRPQQGLGFVWEVVWAKLLMDDSEVWGFQHWHTHVFLILVLCCYPCRTLPILTDRASSGKSGHSSSILGPDSTILWTAPDSVYHSPSFPAIQPGLYLLPHPPPGSHMRRRLRFQKDISSSLL